MLVLTISNSVAHAIEQFVEMWYWFLPLVSGFGIQIGLMSFVKERMKEDKKRGMSAAAGGITVGSMIACCVHHLVEIIPLIGVSAVAVFLVRYQETFFIIGLYSNLMGILGLLISLQRTGYEVALLQRLKIYSIRPLVTVMGISLTFFSCITQ